MTIEEKAELFATNICRKCNRGGNCAFMLKGHHCPSFRDKVEGYIQGARETADVAVDYLCYTVNDNLYTSRSGDKLFKPLLINNLQKTLIDGRL